ncbi:DedA family protein [Candidatus Uhrbacteria bacterium]|nr:MAG: DedA family protein [Candidatus Uhrbacteria bacterium]
MELLRKTFAPLRRLYDWTVAKAALPNAESYLAGLAFIESSFFPIPPDVLLIAMGFSNRERTFRYALTTTLFSIIGGIFGYFIGFALFETIGQPIIAFYHLEPLVEVIRAKYDANAFLAVFTAAFTPIPFKLITISAGLFHVNFFSFVLASVLGRGLRFFAVAGVMRYLGPRARPLIEKYFELFTILFTILLIGGFLVIGYLR